MSTNCFSVWGTKYPRRLGYSLPSNENNYWRPFLLYWAPLWLVCSIVKKNEKCAIPWVVGVTQPCDGRATCIQCQCTYNKMYDVWCMNGCSGHADSNWGSTRDDGQWRWWQNTTTNNDWTTHGTTWRHHHGTDHHDSYYHYSYYHYGRLLGLCINIGYERL